MKQELSERIKKLAPSATLAMAAKTKELQDKGIKIVSLAAGEPNFSAPRLVIEASHAALDAGADHYTAVRGTDELVAVMIAKFARDQKVKYSAQEVLSTVGSKGALSLALDAIIDPGDEVIIFSPYWATYPELVKLSGGVPVEVKCSKENNYAPLAEDLKAALSSKTKAVMLNSPNNPTGAVYSKECLSSLMSVLEESGIWVISDEIYEHLVFNEHKHVSPAALSADARERTLVISGVAKSYAMTGWRVGVVGGPKLLVDALVKLQSQRYTCVTTIAQAAAACAFGANPEMYAEVEKMRKAYENRGQLLMEMTKNMPAGMSCSQPEGAFYSLIDVSFLQGREHRGAVITSDLDVALRLLAEAHVSVVAGSPFGAPGMIRMSLAASEADIKEGLSRMLQWLA